MTIIDDYGGVFRAISKYQDEYGDFPIDSKNEIKNYWTLAYFIVDEYITKRLDEDEKNYFVLANGHTYDSDDERVEESDEDSEEEETDDDSDDPDYDPNCDEESDDE